MKIYDITQELFSANVYPGDASPVNRQVRRIAGGDICNLSELTMNVHNGTHLDAPWHFLDNGKKIDQLDLHKCVGEAVVIGTTGDITAEIVKTIYRGKENDPAYKRILFKGEATLTIEGARELNRYHIDLIGSEYQTVGPLEDPVSVHYELLGREVILLEGLVLKEVPTTEPVTATIFAGKYFLNAAPLKLGGVEGAPCRALLLANDLR